MKKKKWILMIISVILASQIICRIKIIGNALYVQLLSEDKYIYIQKHSAPKEIIKKFKEIKKSINGITYITETSDCLLYTNTRDYFCVIRVIKIENGVADDYLYEPNFTYTVDGSYVHFHFENQFLYYVDEIAIGVLENGKELKSWYRVPISTSYSEANAIIEIDRSNLSDPDNLCFKIIRAYRFGDNLKRVLNLSYERVS